MSRFILQSIDTGYITGLVADPVKVNFHFDEDRNHTTDLVATSQNMINDLTPVKYERLLQTLSVELTEAAYSQSGPEIKKEDYLRLQNDLKLGQVDFYAPDIIRFTFTSALEYPNMQIYVQLNSEMGIEDITVA